MQNPLVGPNGTFDLHTVLNANLDKIPPTPRKTNDTSILSNNRNTSAAAAATMFMNTRKTSIDQQSKPSLLPL